MALITFLNGGMGATGFGQVLGLAVAISSMIYILSRAVGWIIAGFVSD